MKFWKLKIDYPHKLWITFIVLVGMLLVGCSSGTDKKSNENTHDNDGNYEYSINWEKAADSSTNFLIENFWNANREGYFSKTNYNSEFEYWPQAHGLDILIGAYKRTGKKKFIDYCEVWYEGVYKRNGESFINEFYDDMGWNALALLRTYKVTGASKFKGKAINLWEDIKNGWSKEQGGGISWNKSDTGFKNSPSNGPACILATRLYQETDNKAYLNWAEKIYKWWETKLYDASTGFVDDGIEDRELRNAAYIYNQGLFIGASLELYKIKNDKSYLSSAENTADYAISSSDYVTSDSILKDGGGGDGGLFKGIFVRYFTQLILNKDIQNSKREKYVTFLKNNAEQLWFKGTNKSYGLFGSSWYSTPQDDDEVDLTVEESGVMLMEAMALLKRKGLID